MEKRLLKITDYVIRFLLGDENSEVANTVAYSSNPDLFANYKLVIIPSHFFNTDVYATEKTLPDLPLQQWAGIPMLFGSPKTEKAGETVILHADIVASTFFLITRYEETINRTERDEHGRFPGKSSLPFRAGFLHQPIVDEYGHELRKLLRSTGVNVIEPKKEFNKIYLTHDVDQLAHYRNLRGMGGALTRGLKNPHQAFKALQTFLGGVRFDPWFTFPWLFSLCAILQLERPEMDIESIVFIKSGGGESARDKPLHNLASNDFQYLFELTKQNDIRIGLHPSYQAGDDTSFIAKEKKILDDAVGQNTVYTRNHFLRSRDPEDMQALLDAGLTDDFTLGYADIAGFRLGTCRSVRWVNPVTLELTSLTLHPLTMMDNTLYDSRYMNLTAAKAFEYAKQITDEVRKHNGDLVLLWHNTSVEKDIGLYSRRLYEKIMNYLVEVR
ncbi:MAG: polysaccharide deacetylase family protein [Paludibacteraceae bacterium]